MCIIRKIPSSHFLCVHPCTPTESAHALTGMEIRRKRSLEFINGAWVGLLPAMASYQGRQRCRITRMQCSEPAQLAYVLPGVGLAVCSVGLLVL